MLVIAHVTPGWHPAGNKGRRAATRPLLLECDGAGELQFGSTERKGSLRRACIILS